MDTYLRNPLIKEGRLRDLEKKVIKVSMQGAKKNYNQLLDLLTKTLSPLKDRVVTMDRLKELFEPNEKEIYRLISQIKENFIKKALLQDNFHHYYILKRHDLPEAALCQVVSTLVDTALKKIGLSSSISYYYTLGHCFITLLSDDGDIAIDLTSRQIIKTGGSRITVTVLDNYPTESKCLLKTCSMEEKTIAALKTKKALESEFKSARRDFSETLVSEKKEIMTNI